MNPTLPCRPTACALAAAAALAASATAWTPPASAPATAPASPAASMPEPASNSASSSQSDPLAIFRAPLLREGTMLVDVKARLRHDAARNLWLLDIDPARTDAPANRFMLMPCTQLSEMHHLQASAGTRRIAFLVTGRIFVYRGENYLLPSHAPVVTEEAQPAQVPEGGAAAQEAATAPASGSLPDGGYRLGAGDGAGAETIMRELRHSAGGLARHSGVINAPASDTPSEGAAGDDDHPAASQPASVVREDTSVTSRRGKLSRDGSGGWMFIFDADAKGLADPPMRLLPCMLLERIEDYARRVGSNSPAILSGQVFLYQGRNYLLPTVFRVPSERPNLMP